MKAIPLSLLAILAAGSNIASAQTFNSATGYLTLPTVSVDGQIFTNVVVKIEAMTLVSVGDSGSGGNTTPPAGNGSGNSNNPLCVVGASVSILYAGSWYPGKVLAGPDSMNTCKVSYDGYGSSWDEWVSAARLRAPSGTTETPGSNGNTSGDQTQARVATYNCYTFDYGQVNYTYTDVVISAGGRYAVGSSSGTYTLSADGAMTFTGTLSNASGYYSIKNTGKAQIDLRFPNTNQVDMSCAQVL